MALGEGNGLAVVASPPPRSCTVGAGSALASCTREMGSLHLPLGGKGRASKLGRRLLWAPGPQVAGPPLPPKAGWPGGSGCVGLIRVTEQPRGDGPPGGPCCLAALKPPLSCQAEEGRGARELSPRYRATRQEQPAGLCSGLCGPEGASGLRGNRPFPAHGHIPARPPRPTGTRSPPLGLGPREGPLRPACSSQRAMDPTGPPRPYRATGRACPAPGLQGNRPSPASCRSGLQCNPPPAAQPRLYA